MNNMSVSAVRKGLPPPQAQENKPASAANKAPSSPAAPKVQKFAGNYFSHIVGCVHRGNLERGAMGLFEMANEVRPYGVSIKPKATLKAIAGRIRHNPHIDNIPRTKRAVSKFFEAVI